LLTRGGRNQRFDCMSPGYYIYKCLEQGDSWRREDLSDAIGGLQSSPAGEAKCIAWEKTCSARKLANCMKRTVCLWQSRFQENHSCEKRSYSVMSLFTWKAKQECKGDSVVPCSLSCHQFRNRVRHMIWSAFLHKRRLHLFWFNDMRFCAMSLTTSGNR